MQDSFWKPIICITNKKSKHLFYDNIPFPSLLLGCNRQAKKLPVLTVTS